MTRRVIVVGAGASGLVAAGRAAETGAEVLLLEKTGKQGNKVRLSGNGRCNLTNTREIGGFVEMFGPNGRFLYGAFRRFFRQELVAFLARYEVETRAEPDGRVFPASDDAGDVVQALTRYAAEHKVKMRTKTAVTGLTIQEGKVAGVAAGGEAYEASGVVLATGGASYPGTGSTGDGFRVAGAAGHSIVPLRPALVPLVVKDRSMAASMQGVSLRDVRLTAYRCAAADLDTAAPVTRDYGRGISGGKPPRGVIESRRGDVMMTHFGLGGPATLLASLGLVDSLQSGPVSVALDMHPDSDNRELSRRLQGEFDRFGKRTVRNVLEGLLPHRMVGPVAALAGIAPERRANQVTAGERDRLVTALKSLRFDIEGPLSMEAAFVTAGGVSLKEIDPRTMGSRLVGGLYFCGEVMDLDADTGGYNLQAAFSTGYVAGESAATGR